MKDRRPYSRHGLNVLEARVKLRGFTAIDRRTAAARALIEWRDDLTHDLGGADSLSSHQVALVEVAVRNAALPGSPGRMAHGAAPPHQCQAAVRPPGPP